MSEFKRDLSVHDESLVCIEKTAEGATIDITVADGYAAATACLNGKDVKKLILCLLEALL